LILAQNGYKIKHIILKDGEESLFTLNSKYTKIFSNGTNIDILLSSQVIVINDTILIQKYYNLNELKSKALDKGIPIITNESFQLFLPKYSKTFTIFNDKELISASGVLGTQRADDVKTPFVQKIELFVFKVLILGNCIKIDFYCNFCKFVDFQQIKQE
jgi:hypothetical protein